MTNKEVQKTKITTPIPNGQLVSNGRTIMAQGAPPYDLPVNPDTQFFNLWMQLQPGDPCFIGEISRELTDAARRQLCDLCVATGGDLHIWWGESALHWAGVVYPDGKWDLTDFTPIYRAEINAGWALQIIIMASGERFVVTPRGVCSLPEFKWQYGHDLLDHLREQQTLQHSVLESVITHLTSQHKGVWVRLEASDGQEVMEQLQVLACQSVDDWTVPPGYRLIGLV